jgi:hypothetical protein
VTRRPWVRTALRASGFRSSSAATNALDSIYRRPSEGVTDAVCAGVEGFGVRLRFATVSVDQLGSGSSRQRNVRPILRRVAGFERRPNHARRDEFIEAARCPCCCCARRNELGDDATMSRNRDTFAGFDPPDVPAQVVFELPDASGGHNS